MNRKENIRIILEGMRQVMAPLWHSSRTSIHQIVSEKYGITASQFHTLRRIKFGKQSVSELAECLHVSSPNVSRAVDELVQKGYVSRDRMEEDRRRLVLGLTPKAEKLFEGVHQELDQRLEKDFDQLPDDEIEALVGALEILKKVASPQKEDSIL